MGGYGSGRWGLYYKKTTVEDCLALRLKGLKEFLHPGYSGGVRWGKNNIAYRVTGAGSDPAAIWLEYTLTNNPTGGENNELVYPVALSWTPTPWGARRWWFICPLSTHGQPCGRRAAVLYFPPGGRYFGCRHCHNLSYTSAQEAHKRDSTYRLFARLTGLTPEEVERELIAFDALMGAKLTGREAGILGEIIAQRQAEYRAEQERRIRELLDFDPYAHYLTPGELCEKSGLTLENLAALESARLLLPDHGGKYRPKLAGWGRKLAYLLGEGWTLPEVAAWARGRWATPNPRQFPPERAAWRE